MGMLVAGVWNSSGSALDLHFMFIVLVIGAITLLPERQWPGILALVVAASAAFGWCEFIGVAPAPALLTLDPVTILGFRVAYVATSVFTVATVVMVGEYATRTSERELEVLSGIDALTGLANRRRVEHRLEEAIATSTRIRQCAGLLYFDLDHFKQLNDTHGHDAGDALLREVARRMRTMVRAMDLPARIGGDEFVVILTHLSAEVDVADARIRLVAEKLRALLAEPYVLSLPASMVTHRCTASIGTVRFRGADPGVTPEALLHRGDAAMYRAKTAGGDRVCVAPE
jgi:diguanylate cyclase (GGDEF)-like protein